MNDRSAADLDDNARYNLRDHVLLSVPGAIWPGGRIYKMLFSDPMWSHYVSASVRVLFDGARYNDRRNLTTEEDDIEMSWIQRFFKAIFPKSWGDSMDADSRKWMLRCEGCSFERSFWDMGGIRWKATGNQRNYIKCTNCSVRSWHKAYKKE